MRVEMHVVKDMARNTKGFPSKTNLSFTTEVSAKLSKCTPCV